MAELFDAVRDEYRRRWADHTYAYPGVAELLDFLERQGIPGAIFSNKPHEFTVMTVARMLVRWRFEVVQGSLPELPRKPDPTGVSDIARRIGVEPKETVYLGDSKSDMQAAAAAGTYPVGTLWGFRDASELLAGGARMLAENPLEMMTLFL